MSKKKNRSLQTKRRGEEAGLRTLGRLQIYLSRETSLKERDQVPLPLRNFTDILMRRKRLEPDKREEQEEAKPRTPVRVKVKRLERGREVRTPGKGGAPK